MNGAPHEVTSTTATDASIQQGRAAFTTTHWSLLLEAQGEQTLLARDLSSDWLWDLVRSIRAKS